MNTILIISAVSASLAFILYLITKTFSIIEDREKKRKTMFDWVSSNLFDKVYEPLKQSANEISEALTSREYWKGTAEDYQRDVLLFSIAKFLHIAFKNREKVGKDEFFTRSDLSNDYLSRLLTNIIKELRKTIYLSESPDGGEKDESAVTKLYFLATYGKAKNFPEFKSLIEGRLHPEYLQRLFERGETSIAVLEAEINLLKDAYSEKGYPSKKDSKNYFMFVDVLNRLLNDHEQEWRRAKLYAYCALFHKLLAYELHRMYDTWYVGGQENLDLNELFYTIERVFEIEKYGKLCDEYNELCDKEWEVEVDLDRTKTIRKGIENE